MEYNNTLYKLTDKFQELMNLAQEAATEEDVQMFKDTFESLEGTIEDKFEGCAKVLSELEGKAQMLKEEAAKFTVARRTIENNISNLKSYMQNNMEKLKKDKVNTQLFKISINKAGGQRKLHTMDADHLPDELVLIKREADTKKIRDLMKANNGNTIRDKEGNVLAQLEPQGTYLSVKVGA